MPDHLKIPFLKYLCIACDGTHFVNIHGIHVDGYQRTTCGSRSLLQCGSMGSNSGLQAWQQKPYLLSHLVRTPFSWVSYVAQTGHKHLIVAHTDLELRLILCPPLLTTGLQACTTRSYFLLWCRLPGSMHADQVHYPLGYILSLCMAALTASLKIRSEGSECHRKTLWESSQLRQTHYVLRHEGEEQSRDRG